MNRIENIIQYISKENISEEQILHFEESLKNDEEFRKEYESIVRIWKLAKERLQISDIETTDKRENLIADVLASIDIEKYGTQLHDEDHSAFTAILLEVMEEKLEHSSPPVRRINLLTRKEILPILALAAILLIFLLPKQSIQELTSKYYTPRIISNEIELISTSRSENIAAAHLFKDGKFEEAKKSFEIWSQENEAAPSDILFYAISCYESGDVDYSISQLKELIGIDDMAIAYHAEWYLALILIKEKDLQEARRILELLVEKEGVYKQKSAKLIKRLS